MSEKTPVSDTPEVDLTEFYELTYRKPCKVAQVLELLPAPKRKKLEAAMAVDAGRIPHSVIIKWTEREVKDIGNFKPSTEAVAKHRRKECGCAKA